jgi:cation diffusion facilitator CzcD-associated flavoprotein CzcO
MTKCDVAVLGAGPYGLAAGAHLNAIKGLDVRVFGEPMEFWKSYMPAGMFLRSTNSTSNISDPDKSLKITDFGAISQNLPSPIPLARFVDYGLWFQKKALPSLDRRRIRRIERCSTGFRLTMEDGEVLISRRVVIAAGIGPFARRPELFAGLSPRFVTHCSDQNDVSRFQGKRVVVVGAGQSAMETAALVHEAGGNVEVVVREPQVRWYGGGWRPAAKGPGPSAALWKLLYAPTGVGPMGISRIVGFPHSLKYFPRVVQNAFRKRSLRPTASCSLRDRMKNATMTTGRHIVAAQPHGEGLRLELNDGSERRVDHVLLGTGYKVDVSRYSFLAPELIQEMRKTDGFPQLTPGFESSIPGLHFVGAPAGWTFGPLMYFVAGTEFAASNLARHIASQAGKN